MGDNKIKVESRCDTTNERQIGKRTVRFCTNSSHVEYKTEIVPPNELWYSEHEIQQFQVDVCNIVESLRKQKIHDFYNYDTLELLLTETYNSNPTDIRKHTN